MYFGSDNQSGASAKVMDSLIQANQGMSDSYGGDIWTQKAIDRVKEVFEHPDCQVFFVTTGTAANCLALSSMVKPWQTIVCHQQAHIAMDESTAPEFFSGGARLITLDAGKGRLTADTLASYLQRQALHVPHNPVPGALSLTQANEAGQVYSPQEINELATLAHSKGLKVHMDGARFSNAVASLRCTPADLTWRAGVDILCLGASKNGCLAAEMVICFDQDLARDFEFRRKRSGHLLSKGRLLGAQVDAWFSDNHWLELANHANTLAHRLALGLKEVESVELVWPVEANELFVVLPSALASFLQSKGAVFYDWDSSTLPDGYKIKPSDQFVRMVTSFASCTEEVEAFLELIRSFKP